MDKEAPIEKKVIEDDEEEEEKEIEIQYMRLTKDGKIMHDNIIKASKNMVYFWVAIGLCSGYVTASLVENIPFKNKTPRRLMTYKCLAFGFMTLSLGYHGMVVAIGSYKRERRAMIKQEGYGLIFNSKEEALAYDESLRL